jgi:hypothetical protein
MEITLTLTKGRITHVNTLRKFKTRKERGLLKCKEMYKRSWGASNGITNLRFRVSHQGDPKKTLGEVIFLN